MTDSEMINNIVGTNDPQISQFILASLVWAHHMCFLRVENDSALLYIQCNNKVKE